MEEKQSQGNIWKIGFFSLLALMIIGLNVFAWYFFVKGKEEAVTPSPTPLLTPTTAFEPSPTEALFLSPTPAIDETSLIKQAVFKLTGHDESKAEVKISQNMGKHAKGTIKEFEAVGGAYWLAAKVEGDWVGVYDGQANPTCLQIAPYDFPVSLVPECLDEEGNVTIR